MQEHARNIARLVTHGWHSQFATCSDLASDVVVDPYREHTPSVRVELVTPDAVKRHVNNVMDTWLRNLKLTAHQETAIGRACCHLLNLKESNSLRGPWSHLVDRERDLPGPCRHQQMAG